MTRKPIYALLYLAILLTLSGVLSFLWNALIPGALHLPSINYWQALGLLILCRVLFGGLYFFPWRSGWQGDNRQHLLKDKIANMTEDERGAFKQEWRKRSKSREH
jgi:hypothetical protein